MFGKNKFAPNISPAKTWEGVYGAVLLAIATNLLISALINNEYIQFFYPVLTTKQFVIVGLVGGSFAVFGDLCESFMKRSSAVKDSGSLMPGHGGILDRLDSLVYSATPVLFYINYYCSDKLINWIKY